jgi:hypothetical protein
MVADNTLIVSSFHIVSISNEGMKKISKKTHTSYYRLNYIMVALYQKRGTYSLSNFI